MCTCGKQAQVARMPRKLDLWEIVASYSSVKAGDEISQPQLCDECMVLAFKRYTQLILDSGTKGLLDYYGGVSKLQGYLHKLEGAKTVAGAKVGDLALDAAWE